MDQKEKKQDSQADDPVEGKRDVANKQVGNKTFGNEPQVNEPKGPQPKKMEVNSNQQQQK